MNTMNIYKTVFLDRMTAIALLVRLQNGDIPYPHSKRCREQLIYFLSCILTDEDRDESILKIDFEELDMFIDDVDSAFKIIEQYGIT